MVLSVLSAEGHRCGGTGGALSIESRYRLSYFLPNDVDRQLCESGQILFSYTSALLSVGKGGNGGKPSISY